DPGPASCLEALLAGLESEPRALLLTHIHLDHAGASGVLARRFPRLRVYVHEVGAPHVADPARLLKSAGRVSRGATERLRGARWRPCLRSASSPWSAASGSRASRSPTRPATPRTTSPTSTATPATPTSATWRASGSRPAS